MLKRLYVHNYKCLVNFEINFDKDISLFLGANGSGKSTVFEVLTKLHRVIIDEEKVENIFDFNDLPRWLKSNPIEKTELRFEFDIEIDKLAFNYQLGIEFSNLDREFNIKEESLSMSSILMVQSKGEKTVLAVSDDQEFKFDKTRSCIMRYFPAKQFINYLNTFFIVLIRPYEMVSTIIKSNLCVKVDFSNYAEWFAHLNEKNRRGVSVFEQAMRDVLPGFDYFKIELAGQTKVLQVDFQNNTNKKDIISYYFNELSDGQKVLIALYALVYCAPENSLICIDEPENFLALPEIQPWFDTLYDQCAERGLQALLISHHPKIINLLASNSGYWFSRENNLTRVQKISPDDDSGLSIAELIDRGWLYEQ